MANHVDSVREPLVHGNKNLKTISNDVLGIMEQKPTRLWWAGFLIALSALTLGIVAVSYQIMTGIGTWGLNKTVG